MDEEPDVRFTLANERTYLAWVRTALAIIAGGVALPRLLGDSGAGGIELATGVVLVIFGSAVGVVSFRRWRETQEAIRRREPLPPSALPLVLAAAVAIGGVGAAVLLIVSW